MKKNLNKYKALLLATSALTINFWAWSLLSPLGTALSNEHQLSPTQLSLLLAVPVVIGALGRIVFGIIVDKFGGRFTFSLAGLLTSIPVFGLIFCDNYQSLLLAGTFLGIGGASFVIGIPYLTGWFSLKRRGLVLGLYSLGCVGTAVSGFLTPRIGDLLGRDQSFVVVGVLLVGCSILMALFGRNAPGWKPPQSSTLSRFSQTVKFKATWDLATIYAVSFGAYVAFGVYLPVLLSISYDLSLTDAATRAAGFVLIATLARAVGGWLSDKIGSRLVIKISLMLTVVLAAFVAFQPSLQLETTVAYLSLAFCLGCACGAVYALTSRVTNTKILGSVSGVVGAIGGLGGFVPPLILGFTYQYTQSYALALVGLSISAGAVFIFAYFRFKDKNLYKKSLLPPY